MAEARQEEAWNHTAAVLSLLANIHRDPKRSRPYKPADFHPYLRARQSMSREVVPITVLKQVFVDRRAGG
jgi:hypothetical protein